MRWVAIYVEFHLHLKPKLNLFIYTAYRLNTANFKTYEKREKKKNEAKEKYRVLNFDE
jgi:hypothetical protein